LTCGFAKRGGDLYLRYSTSNELYIAHEKSVYVLEILTVYDFCKTVTALPKNRAVVVLGEF
jgi:hypothetical protein